MAERVRPYLFYDIAISLCSTCLGKAEGKIVFQDDKVFMLKRCPRPSRDGAPKCWVACDIDPFLAARRADAHAA